MSHARHRRSLPAAAIAVAASLLPLACTSHAPPAGQPATPAPPATPVPAGQAVPQVRVNQVGYPAAAPKIAFAMLTRPAAEVSFTITGRQGVVFRGRTTRSLGSWNSHYPAVYVLGFSGLTRPGTYRIRVNAAGATAVSPAFAVGSSAGLYHRLVLNAVRYFTSERDGAAVVPSVFARQPANLTDQHAYVYASPRYDSNDNLLGKLRRIGGPVDVAGGWFDAGGG
ncbi:MAG TPA: cellulase N-terminal Ig-like domain-containing protein, partial [Streptosporangiaceae bacterium]|nr:cellulase N-terminal Ig-like domain-containing protein [Streptosporangiaceae bacterium]